MSIQQIPIVRKAKAKPKSGGAPKWELKTKARISSSLRSFAKTSGLLIKKDAKEADTRLLVDDILVNALGYDKFEDLTAEFAVKRDLADYGIRINKQLKAFVEVKRILQELSPKHLSQVESYALKEGVEWAILTNAQVWQVYHVEPIRGKQSEVTLVFQVDILDENTKSSAKADLLFFISKEGLSKGRLDEFQSAQNAISPKTLRPILISEDVLSTVRRVIKRKTKQNVNPKDLKLAIKKILEID